MRVDVAKDQEVSSVDNDNRAVVSFHVQVFDDQNVAVANGQLRVLENGALVADTDTDILGNAEVRLIFDVVEELRKQIQFVVGEMRRDQIVFLDRDNPQVANALVMEEFRSLCETPRGNSIAIFETRYGEMYPALVATLREKSMEYRRAELEARDCYTVVPENKNGVRILENDRGEVALFRGVHRLGNWYNSIEPLMDGDFFILTHGTKSAFADKDGVILRQDCCSIRETNMGTPTFIFEQQDGLKAVLNAKGKIVSKWESNITVTDNGKTLYVEKARLIYMPEFDFWLRGKEVKGETDRWVVKSEEVLYAIVDKDGRPKTKWLDYIAQKEIDGILIAKLENGDWALIDGDGNVIYESSDKEVGFTPFTRDLFLVSTGRTEKKYKLAKRNVGDITDWYKDIKKTEISGIFSAKMEDGKWILIDDNGGICNFYEASENPAKINAFSTDMFLVRGSDSCVIIKSNGEVISEEYRDMRPTKTTGEFLAQLDDKSWVRIAGNRAFDQAGENLDNEDDLCGFDGIVEVREGVFLVNADENYWFENSAGDAISDEYRDIRLTEVEGLFCAQLDNDKWRLIDESGELMFGVEFEEMPELTSTGNMRCLLKAQGHAILINFQTSQYSAWYKEISLTKNPWIFRAKLGEKYILIDDKGKIVSEDPAELAKYPEKPKD